MAVAQVAAPEMVEAMEEQAGPYPVDKLQARAGGGRAGGELGTGQWAASQGGGGFGWGGAARRVAREYGMRLQPRPGLPGAAMCPFKAEYGMSSPQCGVPRAR